MRIAADMTGRVFGRLTVMARAGHKGKQPAWLCQCSCGNTKVVAGEHLRRNRIGSCGCKRRENFIAVLAKGRDKARSLNGATRTHRSITLEDALADVARTWPESLQRYASLGTSQARLGAAERGEVRLGLVGQGEA